MPDYKYWNHSILHTEVESDYKQSNCSRLQVQVKSDYKTSDDKAK